MISLLQAIWHAVIASGSGDQQDPFDANQVGPRQENGSEDGRGLEEKEPPG